MASKSSSASVPPPHALCPADAAASIAVAEKTLANWRSRGIGPPYVKFHGRRVAYLVEDLTAFLSANRVETTFGGGAK